jgi:hypothetical protein
MSAKTLPFQYRGGWAGQQTWSDAEARWVHVAIKGDRRVEQGARTYEQLLNALDRIDGRKVLTDYIAGLQAGLSQEEASKPLPFGSDGEPMPAGAAPEPVAPAVPEPGLTLALVGVQQSIFGGDEW